jgi:hypothetical protein
MKLKFEERHVSVWELKTEFSTQEDKGEIEKWIYLDI